MGFECEFPRGRDMVCSFFCKQAEEFNEAVQVVREWLPHAEAELKFRAISEDEDGILQLIENHEVISSTSAAAAQSARCEDFS
jgi:hypothetical protein